MPTIKDVALLAGVSTATVSRVINRTAYVEPITQARVEEAIKQLNYRRDSRAVAFARGGIPILGLLTGNLADPFFALIAKEVEEVARSHGCQLIVVSGGHDAQREENGLKFLINQGCQAMVVHSKMLSNTILLQYAAQFPAMVLLNRHIPQISYRSIWIDNRASVKNSINYLIKQGHKKIACVTSNLAIEDRVERLEGYYDAMDSANLEILPNWIINQSFNELGGEKAGYELIQNCPEVTAVVTFNDVMAAGVMRSMHKQGLSIPDDISIVGFDDILLARYLYPSLTTMHYPIDKMSHYAATLALKLTEESFPAPSQSHFEATLIVRETVKNLNEL